MRFSEYFNLPGNGQKDYEFLDVRVDRDNMFFIDPTRIEAETDTLSAESERIIQHYFDTVLDLYGKKDYVNARKLLVNSGESNEVFLGYTKGFPEGLGNSEEGLDEVFTYIHEKELIARDLVGRIEDIHVFVEGFGPDKMSDLIASIIKLKLVEFTIQQCDKYNIDRTYAYKAKHWNVSQSSWEELSALLPEVEVEVEGKEKVSPVLLIPKRYTVISFLYDSEKYWQKVISERRQKYHKDHNTELFRKNATERTKGELILSKSIIYDEEVKGLSRLKEYLIEQTLDDVSSIEFFRRQIVNTQRSSSNNVVEDGEIDKIINASLEEFPSKVKK